MVKFRSCRIRFAYTVFLLLSAVVPLQRASADECHAVLKIRVSENRPYHRVVDGCMPNPHDSTYLTDYEPRIPIREGYTALAEQCSACCQARGALCTGYLTGNWIDPTKSLKPHQILSSLQVEWNDMVGNEEDSEPDCICLKKGDVDNDTDEKYRELTKRLREFRYKTQFFAMKDIVDHWTVFSSYFGQVK